RECSLYAATIACAAPGSRGGRAGRRPAAGGARARLAAPGEPLLSSTLLLPDQEKPLTQGWEIKEELDHVVDAVLDSGDCGVEPTTVIDFSQGEPEIVRRGAGDPARFE
ncbi:L-threonylcarbamoyladenylate synthase, partial [Streptomyces mirabilis]|uniref:L-threonylcarbamoyladenylate synthase n=1 Tax=Streptomyces mirabilis TaxID=68239 RepID=UPI003657CC65